MENGDRTERVERQCAVPFELSASRHTRAPEFAFRSVVDFRCYGRRELLAEEHESHFLVAADEAIIALEMESLLSRASCAAVVCASLESALHEADRQHFDGALLDLNLHGKMSFPIADALAEKTRPSFLSAAMRSYRATPSPPPAVRQQAIFVAMSGARALATSA